MTSFISRLLNAAPIFQEMGHRPLCRKINRTYYKTRYPDWYPGYDLLEADWDNCLIFDACRFDMFEDLNQFPGELTKRQSKASCTRHFLMANFDSREARDTVYVTANPQLRRFTDQIEVEFFHIEEVWEDGWDDDLKTVPPDIMTQRVIAAADEYPKKRILAHYLQPHYPFLGSEAEWDKHGHIHESGSIWEDLFNGQIAVSDEEVWQLYRDNLQHAFDSVEMVLDAVEGKTVITSDHGNMVGEQSWPIPIKEYGHPAEIYTSELIDVPWHEFPYESRREITKEEPSEATPTKDIQTVEDRLRSLGYR